MPANPYDAKGLLIASIEDDDPVVFFEPKRIYNGPFDGEPNKPAVPWSTHSKGEVPEGYYTVPIGKAEVVRKGTQVTIVTYGTMVYVCEAAARNLGLDAEIIDVRTMVAARRGHHLHVGEEDRTLPDRARGDALLRVRRRALGDHPGGVLLGSRGADRACRRLGHAVSSRLRVGVLPGSGTRRDGPQGRDGDAMTRYVFKMPDLGEGTVEAEVVAWHVKVGDLVPRKTRSLPK